MTKAGTSPGGNGKSARKIAAPGHRRAARYATLTVEVRDAVARIALARPEVHNAFDATLIAELTRALREQEADPAVRVVVLSGQGRSFCAGADLNWMKEMAGYGRAENLADATALAAMLTTLHRLSKPTIAQVHGSVFGGGVGLVACCDIAFAADDATFSLSETKLGLVPATIGPYVVEAIGARHARRYFLSAERFTATEACRIGLVHDICPRDELEGRIGALVRVLLVAGPRAQAEAKALVRALAQQPIDDAMIADTADRIARIRGSAEGREGVAAFLEKRVPAWMLPRRKR